jgi:acetyl esterase
MKCREFGRTGWILDTPSAQELAEGYGLTTEEMRWSWRQYVIDDAALNDPLVSPARASSLEGLPPAILVTAGFGILRDEGRRYARRLSAAGVNTTLLHYKDAIHRFLWMGGAVDECRQMVDDLAASLREIWG